jgi:A/G-specific adenine glycosylase
MTRRGEDDRTAARAGGGTGALGRIPDDIGRMFAPALIAWQRRCGRHDLPWQGTRDPYRVWLSEIMLQQTQVATVRVYYPRFLARFPDVQALAAAEEDEVMALWSGLGYYSRARHLHRCAQVVVREHGGIFPSRAEALAALPGIGASTAAAIAAFCHGERISIVDGNVRRVLTRLLAFDEDMAQSGPQRRLWALAQALLPEAPAIEDMRAYTQGLMDLGATVCTRSRPACDACPVRALCRARAQGDPANYPVKSRRTARRHESWWLALIVRGEGERCEVWLRRRPAPGIWAGLQCVPVGASATEALAGVPLEGVRVQDLPPVIHALTHRELRLQPLLVRVPATARALAIDGRWHALRDLDGVGLPAPVRQLLAGLA